MPEWKFVLDEQAFDFFRAARGAERQALIRAFAELRTHAAAEASGRVGTITDATWKSDCLGNS